MSLPAGHVAALRKRASAASPDGSTAAVLRPAVHVGVRVDRARLQPVRAALHGTPGEEDCAAGSAAQDCRARVGSGSAGAAEVGAGPAGRLGSPPLAAVVHARSSVGCKARPVDAHAQAVRPPDDARRCDALRAAFILLHHRAACCGAAAGHPDGHTAARARLAARSGRRRCRVG